MPDQTCIEEIKALFEEAERQIKTVETYFGKGVTIPALNELRYCGNHLLRALTCIGDDQREEYARAKRHAQRAIYDAAEASALSASKKFNEFKSRFKDVMIGEVVSDYDQITKRFLQLAKLLRTPKQGDEKNRYYRELADIAARLIDDLDRLDACEEELKKLQLRQGRAQAATRTGLGLQKISLLAKFLAWFRP